MTTRIELTALPEVLAPQLIDNNSLFLVKNTLTGVDYKIKLSQLKAMILSTVEGDADLANTIAAAILPDIESAFEANLEQQVNDLISQSLITGTIDDRIKEVLGDNFEDPRLEIVNIVDGIFNNAQSDIRFTQENILINQNLATLNDVKLPALEQSLLDANGRIDNLGSIDTEQFQVDLNTLQTDLNTLNTVTLPLVQADLLAVENDITDLFSYNLPQVQADLITLDGQLNTLNTVTLPDINNSLDTVSGLVDTLNTTDLPALNLRLNNVEGDILTLNNTSLVNIQDELDANAIILENLNTDLNNLGLASEEVEDYRIGVINAVSGLFADADLESKNSKAATEIAILNNTTIPTINSVIEQVRLDLTNLNEGVFEQLQSDISTLNTVTLPEAYSAIEDLNLQLSATFPITSTNIADDAITTPKIFAGAITADKILANTITANKIAVGAITANEIAADTITANNIAADTITANNIKGKTITADEIAAGTITAGEIKALTITAEEIAATTITGDKLEFNTITADQIATGTITATNIASKTIIGELIAANTIAAENLVISDFTNIVNNPSFKNKLDEAYLTGWTGVDSVVSVDPLTHFGAGFAGKIVANRLNTFEQFDVTPDESYYVSALVERSATASHSLTLTFISISTADVETVLSSTAVYPNTQTGIFELSTKYVVPTGIKALKVALVMGNSGNTLTGGYLFTNVVCRALLKGKLIVDGTITTDHLIVNSINGDRIATNTLNADKIVANSITGDRIAAQTISAENLVVANLTNIVTNPSFIDIDEAKSSSGWTGVNSVVDVDQLTHGGAIYAGRILANRFTKFTELSVNAGESYYISTLVEKNGSASHKLMLTFLTTNFSNVETTVTSNALYLNTESGIKELSYKYVVPAGVKSLKVALVMGDSGNTLTGGYLFTNVVCRQLLQGKLIVDGSITADSLAVNSVGADQIIANSIGSDKIAANSITAGNMIISDFTNLVDGSNFEDNASIPWDGIDTYTQITIATDQFNSGTKSLKVVSGGGGVKVLPLKTSYSMEKDSKIYVEFYLRTTSDWNGSSNSRIKVFEVGTNTLIDSISYVNTANVWTKLTDIVEFTSAKEVYFTLSFDHTIGTLWLDDIVVRRKFNGELIVDGTVTTNLMQANTIDGDRILANSLNASKIIANSITSNEIAANTITTKNLSVANTDNRVTNPVFEDQDTFGWVGSIKSISDVSAIIDYQGNEFAAVIGQNSLVSDRGWDVLEGEKYNLRIIVEALTTPNADFIAGIVFKNAAGAELIVTNVVYENTTDSGVVLSSSVIEAPLGYIKAYPYVRNLSSSDFRFTQVFIRLMGDGQLIVDGSISADKIVTGKITTDWMGFNTIDGDVILTNSLDADKIVANSITSDKIAANAILAKSIAITDFTNLVSGSDFEDVAKLPWDLSANSSLATDQFNSGVQSLKLDAQTLYTIKKIKLKAPFTCSEGEKLYVEFYLRTTTNFNGTFGNAKLRISKNEGTFVDALELVANNNTWTKHTKVVTIPTSGLVTVEIWFDHTLGSAWIDDVVIKRKFNGELIVDGTITTNLMVADSIDGDRIKANTLDADKITANSITSDNIASNSIDTTRLIVADFTNLVEGSNFEDIKKTPWDFSVTTNYQLSTTYAKTGTQSLRLGVVPSIPATKSYRVRSDEFWQVSCWATKSSSWNGSNLCSIVFRNSSGVQRARLPITTSLAPTFVKSEESIGFTVAEEIFITLELDNTAGLLYLDDIIIRRKGLGNLIVDGTITSNLIKAEAIDTAAIKAGAIVASKIAAGTITGDLIAADTIAVKNLVVTDFTNLVDGSDWEDIDRVPWEGIQDYTTLNIVSDQVYSGTKSLKVSNSATVRTLTLPTNYKVNTDEELYIEFYVRTSNDYNGYDNRLTGNSKLRFGDSNNSNTLLHSVDYPLTSSTWQKVSATKLFAVGTNLQITFNFDHTAGIIWIDNVVIKRKSGGELIVDGAITASKISTGAITADKISTLALDGQLITGTILRTTASTSVPRVVIGDPSLPFWYGTGSISTANGTMYVNNSGTIYAKNMVIEGSSIFRGSLDGVTGTFTTATTGQRVEIGSDGTYDLWAGTGTKNDTNASFYIKTNGSGLLRGQLLTGQVNVLKQATSTSTTVETGNHSSKGNSVKVSLNYSYKRTYSTEAEALGSEIDWQLLRSVNGGSFSAIESGSSVVSTNKFTSPTFWIQKSNVNFIYLDTTTTSGNNYNYKLLITRATSYGNEVDKSFIESYENLV